MSARVKLAMSTMAKRTISLNVVELQKEKGDWAAQELCYVPLPELVDSENWIHLLALMDLLVKTIVLHYSIQS